MYLNIITICIFLSFGQINAVEPECGLKRIGAATLVEGETETIKHEYPWVAGIYSSMGMQICAGTIISKTFVLSAAHCFTNIKGVPQNKDNYTIAAGKYYRDINVVEPSSQTKKIKTLSIHEGYKGNLQRYRDDIALIEVDTEFTLTMEVEPVCLDWENVYEDKDFIEGNKGVVAGWGYTQPGGQPSTVLKEIFLPYVSRGTCLENLPRDFSDLYLNPEKICAGYINESTNVCKGDGGAGLYFKSDGTRYFIRGIVSLTLRTRVGCDTNQYALYTQVSKYFPWIENIIKKGL